MLIKHKPLKSRFGKYRDTEKDRDPSYFTFLMKILFRKDYSKFNNRVDYRTNKHNVRYHACNPACKF